MEIASTETLGGGGGKVFAPLKIESIAIRHGNKVDAIIINGTRYGGGGGDQTQTLTLGQDEYINKMVIRHGELIDYLVVYTNKGRFIGGGGNGGRETILEGKILKIGGRSGNKLDCLEIIGQMPLQCQIFGGEGGHDFAPVKIRSIAIRHGNKVDALILNGNRYGGDGGKQTQTLTLGEDEFIDKIVVRHGSSIDYLMVYTSTGRKIGGGGNGGTKTVVDGKIVKIGGKSGNRLDGLQVFGNLIPDIKEINTTPDMVPLKSTKFSNLIRRVNFNKNGYPLDYHSMAGDPWQHLQDMIRLPDANGNHYYMGTFSQNCASDEGGMVFVCGVKPGEQGKVVWLDELNNSHLAGGYNHPGDIRRIGNIVVIAGQNWEGTTGTDAGVFFGADEMHRGKGNKQNVLFYDVSNPAKPRYLGKLNSCMDGTVRKTVSGEIDEVFAIKLGDYYYLSFNGLKCRSKIFFPHDQWEFVEAGGVGSPSPVVFPLKGKQYTGTATYNKATSEVVFAEKTFPTVNNKTVASVTSPIPRHSFSDKSTFSLSTLPDGKGYILFTNVESDDRIEIEEIEMED
jgi:hypothetical protein